MNRRLLEWIDANGNTFTKNNSAASAQQATDLYKDRFMKLAKHIEDCHDWSLVNYMSEWELELEYRDKSDYSFTGGLTIDVNSQNIKVELMDLNHGDGKPFAVTSVAHNEWSKVLDFLKTKGVIVDKKFCESAKVSTIDSIKLYENLWD